MNTHARGARTTPADGAPRAGATPAKTTTAKAATAKATTAKATTAKATTAKTAPKTAAPRKAAPRKATTAKATTAKATTGGATTAKATTGGATTAGVATTEVATTREPAAGRASGGVLPVGTVLAYAGTTPRDLIESGWLPCDGESYRGGADDAYRELYEAIGFAFGRVATNPPTFNVPDLRGLFIRCTPDGAVRDERDPEWPQRTALLSGGHDRAGVGSYQDYGTGRPHQSFSAEVGKASVPSIRDDAGCGPVVAKHTDRTESVLLRGGDLESRPKNKYVHFVIKARSGAPDRPGVLPVGAVVTFAGPAGAGGTGPVPGDWLRCDGREVSRVGPYRGLWDALRQVHGGSGDDFRLPDYRGWFLRGVSGGSGRDPDRDRRTAPHAGGRQGNDVGSQQDWSTGVPTNPDRPARVNFSNLPDADQGKSIAGAIRYAALRNSGSTDVTFLVGTTGDAETRPDNISADFYVVGRPGGDVVPVGTVAMTGGAVPVGTGWLPCDGRTLPTAEHPALVAAIGYRYGGSAGAGVKLPDYRGRFVRGASHDSGRDPDAGSRTPAGNGDPQDVGSVQRYATGAPRNPFMASVPYLPWDHRQISGEIRSGTAGSSGNKSISLFEGGNADSRPANVYLNAYIRIS